MKRQTLKALERRGGLILSVTNVIRKLQTEKEKVLVLPEKAEQCKDESDNEVYVFVLLKLNVLYIFPIAF